MINPIDTHKPKIPADNQFAQGGRDMWSALKASMGDIAKKPAKGAQQLRLAAVRALKRG
jgi:hypothetical protein